MLTSQRIITRLLAAGCLGVFNGCMSVEAVQTADGAEPAGRLVRRSDADTYVSASLPILTEASTLPDYLRYAALNNAGLRAAFNRWKAALERIPQVRSLPDPRFNYAYFIENVETRVGPQEQRLGLAQTFPWFGKLKLRGNVAAEAANAERARYEAAKLKLFYQVKTIYYDTYYLAQGIRLVEENIALLANVEAVARAKYRAGAPLSDLVKAQVEQGKLDDRLRTLQALREPLAASFNAALNRPSDSVFPWPRAIAGADIVLPAAELIETLQIQNPELQALDSMKAREQEAIRLAKKDFYPDVTLGLEYVPTGPAVMPGSDSGKDPLMAMVSVNIPLWRDKYRAGVQEARSRHRAVTEERVELGNRLTADLQMAVYRLQDAQRKIDLFRDTLVPKAEQSLAVTRKAYEAGKMEFLNWIDAQRLLLEFELSYERALADQAKAAAEVEMLVGGEEL